MNLFGLYFSLIRPAKYANLYFNLKVAFKFWFCWLSNTAELCPFLELHYAGNQPVLTAGLHTSLLFGIETHSLNPWPFALGPYGNTHLSLLVLFLKISPISRIPKRFLLSADQSLISPVQSAWHYQAAGGQGHDEVPSPLFPWGGGGGGLPHLVFCSAVTTPLSGNKGEEFSYSLAPRGS